MTLEKELAALKYQQAKLAAYDRVLRIFTDGKKFNLYSWVNRDVIIRDIIKETEELRVREDE